MRRNTQFVCFFILFCFHASFAQVGIGTTSQHASAQLEVSSTTKGYLPPRMTTTQRNAISTPATGLTIYNTTTNAFECYNGTAWYSTVHYVGESYGGGIVFFVYDNGQHGLIAATSDQSSGIAWYNGVFRFTGASADGVGAGKINTAIAVTIQMPDDNYGTFAAKVCSDYSVTSGGVKYGDWYLPSSYELNLLYAQRAIVGGFTTNRYWSSTEFDDFSYRTDFSNGFSGLSVRNASLNVRAIRSF